MQPPKMSEREGAKRIELRISNNKAYVWDIDGKHHVQVSIPSITNVSCGEV